MSGMTRTDQPGDAEPKASGIELSYCVGNTSQRELLLAGLDAIARERQGVPFATEVLVLDHGSRGGAAAGGRQGPAAGVLVLDTGPRDGSAQAAAEHPAVDETIALAHRQGKGRNDSELLRRAR